MNKFCLTIGFVICFGLFGCSKDSDDLFSQCGIAEVGSESSSQKDANTAEISFLLLLKDVENSLLALSAHHHDVIISNSEEEFEKRLVEMNASRRQFEYSLARFSGFSCKSSDDYLNSKINKVAMLGGHFLDITSAAVAGWINPKAAIPAATLKMSLFMRCPQCHRLFCFCALLISVFIIFVKI